MFGFNLNALGYTKIRKLVKIPPNLLLSDAYAIAHENKEQNDSNISRNHGEAAPLTEDEAKSLYKAESADGSMLTRGTITLGENFTEEEQKEINAYNAQFVLVINIIREKWELLAADKPIYQEYLNNLDRFAEYLKSRRYYINQDNKFYVSMKRMLARLALNLQNDRVPNSNKLMILKDLLEEIDRCAPGALTHLDKANLTLNAHETLEHWLAIFRRSIIMQCASNYVMKHKTPLGNRIHVETLLLKQGIKSGLNPYGMEAINSVNEIYERLINLSHEDYQNALIYFYAEYNPTTIMLEIIQCSLRAIDERLKHEQKNAAGVIDLSDKDIFDITFSGIKILGLLDFSIAQLYFTPLSEEEIAKLDSQFSEQVKEEKQTNHPTYVQMFNALGELTLYKLNFKIEAMSLMKYFIDNGKELFRTEAHHLVVLNGADFKSEFESNPTPNIHNKPSLLMFPRFGTWFTSFRRSANFSAPQRTEQHTYAYKTLAEEKDMHQLTTDFVREQSESIVEKNDNIDHEVDVNEQMDQKIKKVILVKGAPLLCYVELKQEGEKATLASPLKDHILVVEDVKFFNLRELPIYNDQFHYFIAKKITSFNFATLIDIDITSLSYEELSQASFKNTNLKTITLTFSQWQYFCENKIKIDSPYLSDDWRSELPHNLVNEFMLRYLVISNDIMTLDSFRSMLDSNTILKVIKFFVHEDELDKATLLLKYYTNSITSVSFFEELFWRASKENNRELLLLMAQKNIFRISKLSANLRVALENILRNNIVTTRQGEHGIEEHNSNLEILYYLNAPIIMQDTFTTHFQPIVRALFNAINSNSNDWVMVKMLIQKLQYNLSDSSFILGEVLSYATWANNLSMVKFLFTEIDRKIKPMSTEQIFDRRHFYTPLHYAVINNNEEILGYLLTVPDIQLNAPDDRGNNALQIAIDYRHWLAILKLQPFYTKARSFLDFNAEVIIDALEDRVAVTVLNALFALKKNRFSAETRIAFFLTAIKVGSTENVLKTLHYLVTKCRDERVPKLNREQTFSLLNNIDCTNLSLLIPYFNQIFDNKYTDYFISKISAFIIYGNIEVIDNLALSDTHAQIVRILKNKNNNFFNPMTAEEIDFIKLLLSGETALVQALQSAPPRDLNISKGFIDKINHLLVEQKNESKEEKDFKAEALEAKETVSAAKTASVCDSSIRHQL